MLSRFPSELDQLLLRDRSEPEDDLAPVGRELLQVEPRRGHEADPLLAAVEPCPEVADQIVSLLGPAAVERKRKPLFSELDCEIRKHFDCS